MSDDLVKRAREVLNGVTDGPWEAALERGCHGVIAQSLPQGGANFVAMVGNDTATPEKEPSRFANATFIAAARELVPAMADRIEHLEAAIKRQAGAAKSLRQATLAEVQHLVDVDRSEYFATKTLDSERDANAILTDRIEELEAKLAEAVEALSLTRKADDLREAYHRLPNDKNRIGDKRSKKSHARDAWLRAFRKSAKASRETLAELKGQDDE